jgi:hypothetical protein
MLSVGIPVWLISYSKLNVPSALYGEGLVAVFILAALLRASGFWTFSRTLHVLSASVPAALMAHIVVEGAMDPTKHNQWPLAIIISAVVGYAATAPGVILGQLIYCLVHREDKTQ